MPNASQKVISQNIPPIIIGGTLSIAAHLGLLYLIFRIFSEETELHDLVIYLIAFIIPATVGGFVAGYFFAKSKLIHTILTAIIFMIGIIYPEFYEFALEVSIPKEGNIFLLKVFLIILFAAMAGGYIGIRMKNKKSIG